MARTATEERGRARWAGWARSGNFALVATPTTDTTQENIMGVPYVTTVTSSINMSQAESATEVTDAFQKAMFDIEEEAGKRDLEVAWGSGRISAEEPTGWVTIIDSGPWLTFDAIGRRA